jgi:peroxiredoxin
VSSDPGTLPADLPVPRDDGAADHLPGAEVPSVPLVATAGGTVDLAGRSRAGTVVVFAYPRTGRPGVDTPTGWDDIPGARGCTPEACSFRDLSAEFAAAGAEVFGLSTQDPAYQAEAAERLGLPYSLLSDADLALASTLRLPTFEVEGSTLLRRLTMVLRNGRVERVLYPVFPPDRAAADALAALAG